MLKSIHKHINADSHFMQMNGIIAEGESLAQGPIGLKITLCQERLSIHSLNASPSNVVLFAYEDMTFG